MKKLLLLFVFLPLATMAQELKENKVDAFTKKSVKRSSWETLSQTMKGSSAVRIEQLEGVYFLNLKIMLPGKGAVHSIQKDAELMLMLTNDSIVTLKNLKFTIASVGGGATGFMGSGAYGSQTDYFLDEATLKILKENKIKMYRIYLSDGYIEFEIKDKKQDILQKLIALF